MVEQRLRKFIMPNVLAKVGTSCYLLADTFFISMAAGADGITALNLALPVYGLIFAIGAMISEGSATRYSLIKSAGRKDANLYFSNGVMWTLLIGFCFILSGVFFADKFIRILGADDRIFQVGLSYFRTVLFFAPCFMTNLVFVAFVRNDNNPKIAMMATLASGIFNIIFDYVFMFPMKMGMVGAALATGISPLVSMAVCMLHYLSKKNTIRFDFIIPSVKKLLYSCQLGVVAFVGEIASGLTTMVFNFILLGLGGNVAVAAYGIIANVSLVGMSLFNGVAQGLQPLASEMHGKGDLEAERRIYKYSVKVGMVIAALLVGTVVIFAKEVVGIFNSENLKELSEYANTGIRIYFAGYLIGAVNIIKSGFYSATDKSRESSFIAILRGMVLIVISAFVLSKIFGIIGVWLAFPVAELLTYILAKIFIRDNL